MDQNLIEMEEVRQKLMRMAIDGKITDLEAVSLSNLFDSLLVEYYRSKSKG